MPNTHTANNLAAFIWSVADLLRGDFKQSQYGRIILPFTLLRRLECVLEPTKDAVVVQHEKVKAMNLPEDGVEKMLLRASKLSFFNTSPMNLSLYHISTPKNWRAMRQPSTQVCNFAHPFQTASQPGRPVCLE
ncbi:MAG: type I restriction-modification system subunit M N-terminal domain-containing protein, partial [Endozoicomonas sp.]|uniref:type I restriction-modification system subunit M N-terminal domain-containing protein n=1 Tax=Endozoicomonas sp. TaxID=1892382 RepID=UPI003D9AEA1E